MITSKRLLSTCLQIASPVEFAAVVCVNYSHRASALRENPNKTFNELHVVVGKAKEERNIVQFNWSGHLGQILRDIIIGWIKAPTFAR